MAAEVFTGYRQGVSSEAFWPSERHQEKLKDDWSKHFHGAISEILDLPDSQDKWLFLLRYWSDLNLREIAQLMDVTPAAITMRMNRMIDRLSPGVAFGALESLVLNHNVGMDMEIIREPRERRSSNASTLPSSFARLNLGFEHPVRLMMLLADTGGNREPVARPIIDRWRMAVRIFVRASTDPPSSLIANAYEGRYIPAVGVYRRKTADIFSVCCREILVFDYPVGCRLRGFWTDRGRRPNVPTAAQAN